MFPHVAFLLEQLILPPLLRFVLFFVAVLVVKISQTFAISIIRSYASAGFKAAATISETQRSKKKGVLLNG